MLLINENLAVSRIINLIAHRENLEVEEFETLESVIKTHYEYILIDNDTYKDGMLAEIESRFKYDKLIFIAPKNSGKPLGFDEVLFKPFLPLDFLSVIGKDDKDKKKIEKSLSNEKKSEIKDEIIGDELKKDEIEDLPIDDKKEILKDEIKAKAKEQVEKRIDRLTKNALNLALNSEDIRELLNDVEINIKISFDFKNKG